MAESLLIAAREAFSELARQLRESATHSGKIRDNTEAASNAAKRTADFERAAREAGRPSRIVDYEARLRGIAARREATPWNESTRGYFGHLDRLEAAARASQKWQEERIRQSGGGGGGFNLPLGKWLGVGTALHFAGIDRMVGDLLQGPSLAAALPDSIDRLMRLSTQSGGYDAGYRQLFAAAGLGSDAIMPAHKMGHLAVAYAKAAGIADQASAAEQTRAGVLASRGFGIGDEVVPQWLGQMRLAGQGTSRDLLPLVSELTGRSQLPGRTDELLHGLLTYTERMERVLVKNIDLAGFTTTAASLGAYAAPSATNPRGIPGLMGAQGMDALGRIDAGFATIGGEPQEMFWASFFARNKFRGRYVRNPAEQAYLREEGLVQDHAAMRSVFRHIGEFTGFRGEGESEKYWRYLFGSHLFPGLSKHKYAEMERWLGQGEDGPGILSWAKGLGYDLIQNPAPPGSTSDIGRLFQAMKNPANRTADIIPELNGLAEKYLTPEELILHGSAVGTANIGILQDRIFRRGPRGTRLADVRAQEATVQNNAADVASNDLFNEARKLFAEGVATAGEASRDLGASFVDLKNKVDAAINTPGWDTMTRVSRVLGAGGSFAADLGVSGAAAGLAGITSISGMLPDWFGGSVHSPQPIDGLYRSLMRSMTGKLPVTGAVDRARHGINPQLAAPYRSLVSKVAGDTGVPEHILAGVIDQESTWDPNAQSLTGPKGLMQLAGDTRSDYGVSDPYDPEQNVSGGARYLKHLYGVFGNWQDALNAYYNGEKGFKSGKRNDPYVDSVLRKALRWKQYMEGEKTSWNMDGERFRTEAPARRGVFGGPPLPVGGGAATVVFVHTNDRGEELARQSTKIMLQGAPVPRHLELAGFA